MPPAFLHRNTTAAIASRTCALLLALVANIHAQENAAPPPQSEMQKWIATTDAQWQAAFKRDVSDVHETELGKVKLQFLTLLEAAITKASGAGDLDGAVALRNEQKRFGDSNVFPEQDIADEAASVKQLRAGIRVQLARVDKDNAARTKALHVKYDQVLAQAQTQLTQRQRLDDALLVKAQRDEVAAAWITPAIKSANEKAEPAAAPSVAVQKSPAPKAIAERPKALKIVSALFGIKNHTVDTTKFLQSLYESGEPFVTLNCRDGAQGRDPAPLVGKETTIIYTINGTSKTKKFREGYSLNFKDDLR